MTTENLTLDLTQLNKSHYKGTDPVDPTFEYLVELWNVIRTTATAITPMQIRCEEVCKDYKKMAGITPEMARAKFMIAAKRYQLANSDKDIIDACRRKGPLIVTNNSIITQEKTLAVKEGYVEDYKAKEASIRQVADIVSMYTTYNQKLKTITTVFTPEACAAVKIPYLDLVKERQSLCVKELDAQEARSKIMFKLLHQKTHPFFWYYILQRILHHESMSKFRVSASKPLVDWYTKQTALDLDFRFDKYYAFNSTKIELYNMSLDNAWIYGLRSDALRGIAKKRGIFTVGYYSFPLPSSYIKWLSEAKDILTVARERKIRIIEMIEVDRILIQILVHNGLSILNKALSVESGEIDPVTKQLKRVGVYASIPEGLSVSLYRKLPMKPVLDRKTVKFAKDIPMQDGELRSMYLHGQLPACSLYPSVRVADGVVMGYYSHIEHAKITPKFIQETQAIIVTLGTRFCRAITWRNVFPFTRVPYYLRDSYREFFVKHIRYPRLTEKEEDTMFDNMEVEAIDLPVKELAVEDLGPVYALKVPEKKFVPAAITIDDEFVGLLIERSESKNEFECHHKIWQALVESPHANPYLLEYTKRNVDLYWDVMRYIENKIFADRQGLIETPRVVQFNYSAFKAGKDFYSLEPVDYVSYESEEEEDALVDDPIEEESEYEGDGDNKNDESDEEDVESDDDLFKQTVSVGADGEEQGDGD